MASCLFLESALFRLGLWHMLFPWPEWLFRFALPLDFYLSWESQLKCPLFPAYPSLYMFLQHLCLELLVT